MRIDAIELRLLNLDLIEPFNTSYGSILTRAPIIVRVFGEGHEGWGECSADVAPASEPDPVETAWAALEGRLATQVMRLEIAHPMVLNLDSTASRTATASLEMAVWDLHAKVTGLPLWHHLRGSYRPVPVGVVVGMSSSIEALLETVARRVGEGYRRIKFKIGPDRDLEPLAAVRSQWPDLAISADANGSYDPNDSAALRALDDLRLQYVEQPFPAPDIEQSAFLAQTIRTPVCLDESLPDRAAVHSALTRHSHFVINAKPARLGGFVETLAVHRLAVDAGADVWCGGYLETGIGRAHLIALATLPGFTLPGDISASSRYWTNDLVEPEWMLTEGDILPSKAPGIGVQVDEELLSRATIRRIFLEV